MTAEQHRLVALALDRIAQTPAANVLAARPGVVAAVTLPHARRSVCFRRVGGAVRVEFWSSWGVEGEPRPEYFPLDPGLAERAARLIDRRP